MPLDPSGAARRHNHRMRRTVTAIVERDLATGILVASLPGLPGAHSQGDSLEEAWFNLQELLDELAECGPVKTESMFVATICVRAP